MKTPYVRSPYSGISAALNFDRVDILRIELRPDVAGDVGIRHRHAVDEPGHLVAAADMKLVVDEVRPRHELRHHVEAVRTKRSRCPIQLVAGDQAFRRRRLAVDAFRAARDSYRLGDGSHRESDGQWIDSTGANDDGLFDDLKAVLPNHQRVLARWNRWK